MLPVLYVCAIALCDDRGRVLLAQRPEGKDMAGLWEFPGGKIHEIETPEAALVREMKEELGIDVCAQDLHALTFASHAYDRFHLFMPLYLCHAWTGTPHPLEGQNIAWVDAKEMDQYSMPPADHHLKACVKDHLEGRKQSTRG